MTDRTGGLIAEASETEPGALVDVFISYARTDEAIARNLAELLTSEGFAVWFDSKIYAGASWESMLMSRLTSARAVVVLWSKESVGREWVLKEAGIALRTDRLVPVMIDDCTLPDGFDTEQTAMMPGWTGAGSHPRLEQLLSGIARLAPPSRIDNVRPGFDTEFLDVPIDLPAVTGVADEFRYLHFSVVMNPARRLAWYVAYNVQPATSVVRGDRWLADPMLPASFQPQNDHFRGTGYDRGHLVSPKIVSWGEPRLAQLANHQAFFWTNTAPQHAQMNRDWWMSVENWEVDLMSTHERATGFAGPVLADDDPAVGQMEQRIGRLRVRQNFQRPRRFWKIVLTSGDDGLQCAAFLLDQEALVKQRARRMDASAFRCTVSDIESATSLDFGETVRTAGPLQGATD